LLTELHQAYIETNTIRIARKDAFSAFESQLEVYRKSSSRREDYSLSRTTHLGASKPVASSNAVGQIVARTEVPFSYTDAPSTPSSRIDEFLRFSQDKSDITEQSLAKTLADCLRLAAGEELLVLMLDAYEAILSLDVRIQTEFLAKLQGSAVLIVIAGQCDLIAEHRLQVVPGRWVYPMHLESLTRSEARKYLRKIHIRNKKLQEAMCDIAGGIPHALAVSVDFVKNAPSEQEALKMLTRGGSRDVEECTSYLVQEWLGHLPQKQRNMIEAGCVLRQFDKQSLRAVLGEEPPYSMANLIQFRFIEILPGSKASVHESIRSFVRRYLILEGRLDELNRRAADFFSSTLNCKAEDPARFEDDRWCRTAVEWLYHLLQVDMEEGTLGLLGHATDAIWYGKYEVCLQLLNAFVGAERVEEWVDILRDAVEASKGINNIRAIELYENLLKTQVNIGKDVLTSIAHDSIADQHLTLGQWDKARPHLDMAARYFEKRGYFFKLATAQR
jgi:tetratricopeptide (TPR) repeat protein